MRSTGLVAIGIAVAIVGVAPAATADPAPSQALDQKKATTKKAAGKKKVVTPFKRARIGGFGSVLTTKRNQALYWWEKDVRGRVVCTGSCARDWPPLVIPRNATVPRKIRGVRGRFGTKLRPDGRRQVTYNGYPIYSYAHEPKNVVWCNNVDRWFVARARGLR